jgi:ribonuclease J
MTVPQAFSFIPLGGCQEIGMNLNVYAYKGKLLVVDCGVTFGDASTPGIDLIVADPGYLLDNRDKIVGLVCTHGHEDHIGAIPYVWPELECPIYATDFTAALVRQKLLGVVQNPPIKKLPLSGTCTIGPFTIELITLTHSIPEPNAVLITTKAGSVLHTGDWKLDPDPRVGQTSDEARLRSLGQEGVLAMVCDSTNVFCEGSTGSEADVAKNLIDVMKSCEKTVFIGCFATNVARVQSIAEAALACDRAVALVGKSMWRIDKAARDTGYLKHIPPFLDSEQARLAPRHKLVYIATGSQGESRAALGKIARGEHPDVAVQKGDTVIFSSRVIPGNEKSIYALQNQLSERGAKIITEKDAMIHVSGHPSRDDLKTLYDWVRPKSSIPVHGEPRHIREHAAFAKTCGVPHSLVAHNGAIIKLEGDHPTITSQIDVTRMGVHGSRLMPLFGQRHKRLHQVLQDGYLAVCVPFHTKKQTISKTPVFFHVNLLDDDEFQEMEADFHGCLMEACLDLEEGAKKPHIIAMMKKALRQMLREEIGRNPRIDVVLMEG